MDENSQNKKTAWVVFDPITETVVKDGFAEEEHELAAEWLAATIAAEPDVNKQEAMRRWLVLYGVPS